MNLQDIQTVLGKRAPEALESLYKAFLASHPEADMDQFVLHLVETKTISASELQEIHLLEPIEVTHIDLLSQSHLLEQQLADSPVKTNHTQHSEQYEFLGVLGQGAMGLVHRARDKDLMRVIAYKQLLQEMAQNRGVLRRFLNEVQITAQLDHPNIVPIYNLDIRPDGSLAYAMKMVKGKTFKDLIQEAREFYDNGQTPDEEHSREVLLGHFLKVLDAMAYAHNKQVIHRDLKPANIMVGEYNEVYVMDWGIAKLFRDQSADEEIDLGNKVSPDLLGDQTQMGQIVGTPRYMSPQQAAGKNKDLDGRSDQFSLGLILYELVLLKPAFTAKSQVELLKKVLKVDLEPFEHYAPKVKIPPELKAIILKATARKAEHRYASTGDFAQDLRRFLRGEAIEAQPDNLLRKTLRWLALHKKGTALTVMTFLGLSAAVTVTMTWRQQIEIKQAHQRENVLSSHLTQIAAKSQQLDSEFLKIQSLLEKLVAAAEFSLAAPVPSKFPKLYFNQDFAQAQSSPPDFKPSKAYRRSISVGSAGVKLAPGVQAKAVQTELAQLSALTPTFQALFQESATPRVNNLTALQSTLNGPGLPLVWAYIGLEKGIHFAYPGKGGYKASYDPRQRPWYQWAENRGQAIWGQPYLDASGQGLLLPCVHSLSLKDHHKVGVAGVELSLEHWLKHLLPMQNSPGIENIYLLNQKGEIVVQTNATKPPTQGDKLVLQAYPYSDILTALKKRPSGHGLINRKNAPDLLVAYTRLNSLGWFYVVESNANQLFNTLNP